jgi:hypothetical protein
MADAMRKMSGKGHVTRRDNLLYLQRKEVKLFPMKFSHGEWSLSISLPLG